MQIWKNGSAIIGLAACHANWELEQVRRGDQVVHPMRSGSFVGRGPWLHATSPLQNLEVLHLFRWYTHTHAPQQRGLLRCRPMRWRWRWKENGNEMTAMEMRWQLLIRDTGRGNTNINTPSPEGANPERAREKKSGRTTGQTQTRGGGADGSAWHNLQGESQTYLGTRRTQTWPREGARMRKGTNGELVDENWCTHKRMQESW